MLRSLFCAPPVVDPRAPSFNAATRSKRMVCSAGPRPNRRPAIVTMPHTNSSTRRIHCDRPDVWDSRAGQVHQRRDCRICKEHSGGASGQRQQSALGEQLPQKPSSRGSQRGSHRHLAPARRGARPAAGSRCSHTQSAAPSRRRRAVPAARDGCSARSDRA